MNKNLPSFAEAEARNKLSHFTVQGYDINGVIQAGAHNGEEMDSFIRMGIENLIAFEPLSSVYSELEERYGDRVACFKLGLHDTNTVKRLNIAGGDGKGSSIFQTIIEHPEVQANWNQGQAEVVGHEDIELVSFKTWAKQYNNHMHIDERGHKHLIDLSQYDTLQLDTQGNEMEILLGMGGWLKQFKYLCIELSSLPVYVGETPGAKVASWLSAHGFTQDSPIYDHNDSFFVRRDIKKSSDRVYLGRC